MIDYKNMSKVELKTLLEQYKIKQAEIESILNARGNELILNNVNAPFRKWSIDEKQQLFNINQRAFEYLANNPNDTIADYNVILPVGNKIYVSAYADNI